MASASIKIQASMGCSKLLVDSELIKMTASMPWFYFTRPGLKVKKKRLASVYTRKYLNRDGHPSSIIRLISPPAPPPHPKMINKLILAQKKQKLTSIVSFCYEKDELDIFIFSFMLYMYPIWGSVLKELFGGRH